MLVSVVSHADINPPIGFAHEDSSESSVPWFTLFGVVFQKEIIYGSMLDMLRLEGTFFFPLGVGLYPSLDQIRH